MSRKEKIIFILIVFLAAGLRLYSIQKVPESLSSDEAAFGYNAYSLLHTGKDEYRVSWPLTFKSFGEYKAPLYVYSVVPAVAVLGLTELATRLPAGIFGMTTIVVVYYLARELWKNSRLALVAAFVLAILPWHIIYTRIAYEGSAALFFLTAAVWLFVRNLKRGFNLWLSSLCFGLTFYSHYAIRIFVPLFILALVFTYKDRLRLQIGKVIVFFIIGIVVLMPLVPTFFSESGIVRGRYVSFFTDQGLTLLINEKRAEHGWSSVKVSVIVGRFLHNKATEFGKRFVENYLSHFNLTYLAVKGDEDTIFTTPNSGPLLIIFLLMAFVGLVSSFKKNPDSRKIVLSWLFLAPVPSALTRLSASTNRTFIIVVPFALLIALGVSDTWRFLIKHGFKYWRVGLLFIVAVEFGFFLDNYCVHAAIKRDRDARVGNPEMIRRVAQYEKNYDQVWVTSRAGGYIHFLFYLNFPPAVFQTEASRTNYNEAGFIWIQTFGKYRFDRMPRYYDFSKNWLYVAEPQEAPQNVTPLTKTYFKDGQVRFILFNTRSVKKACPVCGLDSQPADEDIYGEKKVIPTLQTPVN